VEENGVKVVLTLLLAGSGNILRNPLPVPEADVKLKQLCLEVLAALCLLNTAASEFLGETDEVLIYCFHLLNHQALYAKACLVIEHILMAKRCTLNLCVIPRLPQLLARLEGGRLATFCKILAVTVSDLDIFEHKSSLYQQNIQKRSDDFIPVRDINQELVLSVAGTLTLPTRSNNS
jgi:Trpc4-associated protein